MTAGLFVAAALPSALLVLFGAWVITQMLRARKPIPLKLRATEERRSR